MSAERTHLAARRTMMAADRSLMAWVRTALSMISFGFTIYKVLQGLGPGSLGLSTLDTPRNVGLFLSGLGTVSMVMGTIEYWYRLAQLRELEYFRIWRPSFVIALVMSGTGTVLFVGIVARIF